ncbi:MAG: hypothetical protein ACUVUC_00405 [Thermoguttaceae bacterium]
MPVWKTTAWLLAGWLAAAWDCAPCAGAGRVRKLSGKHLTLYTDLPSTPAVDALPEMFDQAVPQWCAYFGLEPARHADWHVVGCVMKDRGLFEAAGLLPEGLPPFPHGYSIGRRLWVYEQASDYYRAHLVLHEGTHAFMNTLLGGSGPPWYAEGMAELLATHRWAQGRLTLGWLPASREEVPMWGRIKIVRDEFAACRAKTLRGVLQYGPQAHQQIEPYGWCWAAAIFLDRHPRYQARFRQLARWVREPDFTDRFLRLIGDEWDDLAEQWQLFVADLEYGYDFQRTAVDFSPGRRLSGGKATIRVAADRGWQNSGIRLESGVRYRLQAAGRYQVADRPQIWWCEPNGVSIRYYRGLPLGILLAAVRPDRPAASQPSPLIRPIVVGLGSTLSPEQSGTLYLRINDSAGQLQDNAGTLTVQIEAQKGAEE